MDRREFIRKSVPVSLLPFALNGFSIRAYGRSPLLDALVASAVETDHVLVLIQLNGGNDGLNMVIPLDQYSALSTARGNILIPEKKVLNMTTATGFHPAMTGLHDMFMQGRVSVLQSVGYPNPNFSHFRATDIWLSASDSNQNLSTGWMGRYLDQEYPDYPNGYPSAAAPDPLAIQIGSVVSGGFQGPHVSMGFAITSSSSFYQLVTGAVDAAPDTPAGHELTFIRHVVQQTQAYTTGIKAASSKAKNLSTMYPAAGQNSLADQLKIVAQLIAGGLKTRIYVVNIGGFDTHAAQVNSGATETGSHATLLSRLSTAITAFQDDLKLLGADDRVIGMTFSEFGRRINSNASLGTDHGTAAPLIVFGKNVYGGILGQNPIIPAKPTNNDNLKMQFDFRSVYASLLKDWFQVPATELQQVLLKDFETLPIVNTTGDTGTVGGFAKRFKLYQNYPNPFNGSTQIKFFTMGDPVSIKLYNEIGQQVGTVAEGTYSFGEHVVSFDAGNLPSGVYYYRINNGNSRETKSMLLVR